MFGAGQYSIRLWVRPDRLAQMGITVPEIISAVQAQNNSQMVTARARSARWVDVDMSRPPEMTRARTRDRSTKVEEHSVSRARTLVGR